MNLIERKLVGFHKLRQLRKKEGLLQSSENDITRHESLNKFVTGKAEYIDDFIEENGTLHAYIGKSDFAKGKILDIDVKKVSESEGVVDIFSAKDLPGINDISPTGLKDEPVLADKEVSYYGQPLFVVVAKTRLQARKAASLVRLKKSINTPLLDIEKIKNKNPEVVTKPLKLERGNVDSGLKKSKYKLSGTINIGGQDHFYLEGHIAMAKLEDSSEVIVLSSTQHPTEVQHMVAKVLNIPFNKVIVKVKRMGGGFGGKETQSNLFAVVAALASVRTGKSVKIRPDRDDDMIMTGKRHPFYIKYNVGFEKNGQIMAVDALLSANCGFSSDLSGPITDRALFHSDNCYFYPNVRLISRPLKTNKVSNTAFRGFGGPQGMMLAERIIQEIAFFLKKDTLEIKKINLYKTGKKSITPYFQKVSDNISKKLILELEKSSNYEKRRKEIIQFNNENKLFKKGIALTPVKFGISFTATWFNQGGALVHIYTDGSVTVNHGGTEMGQGLHTKVLGVITHELGVSFDKIKITDTDTSKIANTSATAASSGSDLNGMAAYNAVKKIKKRLINYISNRYEVSTKHIKFKNNYIFIPDKILPFHEIVKEAYLERIQLWDSGFYKTPKIHWDRNMARGKPFYYYSYGAAVSEVLIDTLTGEYEIKRVDILHDVGKSLNKTIDMGQIEGGFIQGMGWLTCEELFWGPDGALKTHAPSTYKIPLASDRPDIFNIKIASWSRNLEKTIKRSKAVGEPPFMLAISVHEAIQMAVASVSDYKINPRLNAPATPEEVLSSIYNTQRITQV